MGRQRTHFTTSASCYSSCSCWHFSNLDCFCFQTYSAEEGVTLVEQGDRVPPYNVIFQNKCDTPAGFIVYFKPMDDALWRMEGWVFLVQIYRLLFANFSPLLHYHHHSIFFMLRCSSFHYSSDGSNLSLVVWVKPVLQIGHSFTTTLKSWMKERIWIEHQGQLQTKTLKNNDGCLIYFPDGIVLVGGEHTRSHTTIPMLCPDFGKGLLTPMSQMCSFI